MANSLNVTPNNCTMSTYQESTTEQLAERTDYTYSASKSYRTANAKKKVRSPNMSRRSLRTKDYITIESGLDREDVTPTNLQLYYDGKQFRDRTVRASEDEVLEVYHTAGSNPFASSSSTVTHTLHYGLDYDSETDDFTRQSTSRHSLLHRARPLTASSAVPQPTLSSLNNNVHNPCVMKNELHESALSRLSSASYTVLTALPRAFSRTFSSQSQASQSPVNNNKAPSAYHLSSKHNKRTLRSGKTITTYDSEDEVDQIESEDITVGINGTVKKETHYSVVVYILTFFSLFTDVVSTACTTVLSTSSSAVSSFCTTTFSTSTSAVSRFCSTAFSTSTSAVYQAYNTVYSAVHKACVSSGACMYFTQPIMSLYHSLVKREEEVVIEEAEITHHQKKRSACAMLWWLLLPLLLFLLLLTGLGYSEKTSLLPSPLDAASVTLSDSVSSLASYCYYLYTNAFSYIGGCVAAAYSYSYAFAVTAVSYIYTSTVTAVGYIYTSTLTAMSYIYTSTLTAISYIYTSTVSAFAYLLGALQYTLGATSDSVLSTYDSVIDASAEGKESISSYYNSLSTGSWGLLSTIGASLQWLLSTLVYALVWLWQALLSTLWMLWSLSSSGVSQVSSGVVTAGQSMSALLVTAGQSMSALLVTPYAYKEQEQVISTPKVVESSPHLSHPSMEEILAKVRGLERSLLAMEAKISNIEKSQGLFGATVSKCCDSPQLSLADVNSHVTSLISSLIGYSGEEASPEDLKAWMQSYFVAKNVMDERLKDINAQLMRDKDESSESVASQVAALRDTQSLVMSQIKEDLGKQFALKVEGLDETLSARVASDFDAKLQMREEAMESKVRESVGVMVTERISQREMSEEKVKALVGASLAESSAHLNATVMALVKESIALHMASAPTIPSAAKLTVDTSNSAIDENLINKMVTDALQKYDADRTGMADHALESGGGSIVSTRCTENYDFSYAHISMFGFPFYRYSTNTPRTLIQPERNPGQCWAFRGSQGYVVIRLVKPVRLTGFTLEHIPVELSPHGTIDSAPKEFSIWGLTNADDDEGVKIGDFEFTLEGGPLQYFATETQVEDYFPLVELKIKTNHGNTKYTCVYRLRVHGVRLVD